MSNKHTRNSDADRSNSTDPREEPFTQGRRGFMKTANVLTLGLLGSVSSTQTGAALTRTGSDDELASTLYTAERRAAARENVEQYGWAETQRETAVESADEYLQGYGGLDGLWRAVTAQSIPRTVALSDAFDAERPRNSAEVHETFSVDPLDATPTRRPWERIDSTPGVERQDMTFATADPWKIVEPTTGAVFPTNDFAAYRESGRDDTGAFDPTRADDSLLVNEERPDKPADWGVDDGTGWVDEHGHLGAEGARYQFVAYYNRMYRWERLLDALRSFRDAYLFTDDSQYLRAGAVLLDRIADVYPEMDIAAYRYEDGYLGVHEWTGQGKIGGCVQEAITVRTLLSAFDAFRPAMDDETLLAFLREKSQEYDVDAKDTAADLRRNVEENVVRSVLPAVQNHRIHSPSGGHRTALAMAGAVQDEPDGFTSDIVEFLLQPGERTQRDDGSYWGDWQVTGGSLRQELVDTVDRDGNGCGSPVASETAFRALQRVTSVLAAYDGYDDADLADHPKLERAAAGRLPQILREKYLPRAGAMGRTGNPWLPIDTAGMLAAFQSFGSGRFAKAAFLANDYSYDGMHGSIFTDAPKASAESIQEVIDAEGPLELSSTNQAGTGFAALRDGEHYVLGGYRVVTQFPSMTILENTADYTVYSGSGTLQFEATTEGQHITFQFSVPVTDSYEFSLQPFEATGYGIYEVLIDGQHVAKYDFYSSSTGAGDLTVLADAIELAEGTHTLTFSNVGRNENTDGDDAYKLGLITATFLDETAQRQRRLKAERGNTQRSFSVQYGSSNLDGDGTRQGHRDALHLDVHAYGGDLAPDLGYPEQTGFWPDPDSPGEASSWPKGEHWTSNTISHNTVVVDQQTQRETEVGSPRHFTETDRASIVDVESPDAYPQSEQYRRTTAMVRIDESHSYAVDFFRVVGGSEHVFSFHGAAGAVTTEHLDLTAQENGTYAGSSVQRPAYGEASTYDRRVGSGFNYLDDVAQDKHPGAQFSINWDVQDTWGAIEGDDVSLRLTTMGEFDNVALANGRPPRQPGAPSDLRYVLARRRGSDLDSTFTSVIEPYRGERAVESITEVPAHSGDGPARAVEISLANGRTDYVAYAPGESVCEVEDAFRFDGFLAIYSERDGEPQFAQLEDGSLLAPVHGGSPFIEVPVGAYEGRLETFTRDVSGTNELEVRLTGGPRRDGLVDDLVGRWIYVETETGIEAYRIEDATESRGNRLTLDVGEQTTVSGFVDPSNLDAGYEYTVEAEASFRIPRSHTWTTDD